MGIALVASACGAKPPPPAPPHASQPGVLSEDWLYQPATDETARVTGGLEVVPQVGSGGPARLLRSARGQQVVAELVGPVEPSARIEMRPVADVVDARPGGAATVYRVVEGNFCAGAQATHVIWYEPELIEGRTLSLAFVAGGAPGETGSTVCRILRYTRSRTPASEDGR